MRCDIFYFDEVEIDLKEAQRWYRATDKKLESRFLSAIANTILKLQEWPKAYSIRYRNIRIAHPPVFPYAIHFYIDDDKKIIVVIAIVHRKRHPDYAKKRLP